MRVLILTQYYPPEIGAPQTRLFNLSTALIARGISVTVLTGFPNYPQYKIFPEYTGKLYMQEKIGNINVRRAWIFASTRKGVIFRLLNYFSFTLSSLFLGLLYREKVDVIFCESPPLFLGMTAVILSWAKRAKLNFNVSDLWPESAVKLGIINNRTLITWAKKLEEWIYKKSDFISGQTQGIIRDISTRFPEKPILWLPNGVHISEISKKAAPDNWRTKNGFSSSDFLCYYGGLMGYAQGLDCIIYAAKSLQFHKEIKFVLVGDGPEKSRLLSQAEAMGLNNIFFFDAVPKEDIYSIIQSIDVGIVPLKKIDLFLGAIPSKIFEISFFKKPILLGVRGEAKELFVDQANAGLFFEPEDHEDLASKVLLLFNEKHLLEKLGRNGHQFVKSRFDTERIADEFCKFFQIDGT